MVLLSRKSLLFNCHCATLSWSWLISNSCLKSKFGDHSQKMPSDLQRAATRKRGGGEFTWGHTNQRSRSKEEFDVLIIKGQGGVDLGQLTVGQLGSISLWLSLKDTTAALDWLQDRTGRKWTWSVNEELGLYFVLVMSSSIKWLCKLETCLLCLSSRLSTFSVRLLLS